MKWQVRTILLFVAGTVLSALASGADKNALRDFYHPCSGANGRSTKTIPYTIRPGETLFHVAAEVFGDPYRAEELAKSNDIEDPLAIEPGTVIRVPTPQLRLRYSVYKFADNKDLLKVSESEELGPGDRFRMWVSVNCDGYLYILNRDAQGDIHEIAPFLPGNTAHIRRFREYLAPHERWLRIDQGTGDEELWILLSLVPLAELETDSVRAGARLSDAQKKVIEGYLNNDDAQGKETSESRRDSGDDFTIVAGPAEGSTMLAHRITISRLK